MTCYVINRRRAQNLNIACQTERHYYGKPFWTKAVEFYSDGRDFTRTIEILLGRSRFYSDDRDFTRTVEILLGRSRFYSDGRDFTRTVEIFNFLRRLKYF